MNSKWVYNYLKSLAELELYRGFRRFTLHMVNGIHNFNISDLKLEYDDWLYKVCRDLLNEK